MSFLLSIENDSGSTIFSLYPFAAAANASAIPVFPLVGSMIVVSLFIFPSFSASSINDTATLSFTLLTGLNDSIFTSTFASIPSASLLIFTSGVFPIVSVISFAIGFFNISIFSIAIFSLPFLICDYLLVLFFMF